MLRVRSTFYDRIVTLAEPDRKVDVETSQGDTQSVPQSGTVLDNI